MEEEMPDELEYPSAYRIVEIGQLVYPICIYWNIIFP